MVIYRVLIPKETIAHQSFWNYQNDNNHSKLYMHDGPSWIKIYFMLQRAIANGREHWGWMEMNNFLYH